MSEHFTSKIDYPFVIIPTKIFELGLTPIEQSVLCRIIFRAGRSSECFESRASIAKACGISPRSVTTAMDALELSNIIIVQSRKQEGKTNVIMVNDPAQWLGKRQIMQKREGGCAPFAQGGVHEVLGGCAGGAHGTILTELDPIELDPLRSNTPEKSVVSPVLEQPKEVPTAPAWRAYEGMYVKRYGVKPARNTKVNSQLKQFCERVGYQDAPAMLAFYLTINDTYYVRQMHTLGIALADAEKLSAAYRRGAVITRREADYIDKTTSRYSAIDTIVDTMYGGSNDDNQ